MGLISRLAAKAPRAKQATNGHAVPEQKSEPIPVQSEPEPDWFPSKQEQAARTVRRREAVLTRLEDVQAVPLEWLWPGKYPLGKISLISGDPSVGKTMLICDMASRISTGSPWPDDGFTSNPAGGVVIMSCEDDLSDTLKPRLLAAGADCSRIMAVEGIRLTAGTENAIHRGFDLGQDLTELERAIDSVGDCRAIFIDPISGFMGDVNANANSEVRSVLSPLAEMAARRRVAIIGINHLAKHDGGGKSAYRSLGSIGFVAAARAAWGVAKDPDNPKRRLMLPIKMNLGEDPTGLAYEVVNGHIRWSPEPLAMHADDLCGKSGGGDRDAGRREAADFLVGELSAGPVPSRDVIAEGRELGYSESTLRRAFRELNGKAEKTGLKGGWVWSIPEDGQFGPEDDHFQ